MTTPPALHAPGAAGSRRRVLASAAAGTAAALLVWFHYAFSPDAFSDIDQLRIGARALLAGRNPYEVAPTAFPWPLYYPLPAVIVCLPLAWLPEMAARCIFAFATTAACTWAVLSRHRAAGLLLLSGPFLYAVQRGQWSPLVLAACLIPVLGIVTLSAKPTIGLGALLYRPSRIALVGAGCLLLLSLAWMPRWPIDWVAAVSFQPHLRSPLLLPGGFVLGLALLRWRRPETRLLLALAAVPQTLAPYDLVPLGVVPRRRVEVGLVFAAWTALYLIKVALNPAPLLSRAQLPPDYVPPRWWAVLVFGYLPILLLILRRPNVREDVVDDV